MMIKKENIVLFRTQGNLMLAMVEGSLTEEAEKKKFVKLQAPRVIVISGDPSSGMQMTLVPYGVMSSKTFLNDSVENNNYYTMFNSDMIEAEIPREFLSNQILNAYIGTLMPEEVPTLTSEDIPELKSVDFSSLIKDFDKKKEK